jgi:PHD/YefM family antitoxin component YafN of YafNO toxin-antitoxin module
MHETTANLFRQNLKTEVDRCVDNHEVLRVTRRSGDNFIVLSESDWKAIEETLYLNQVPGLVDSIAAAASESLDDGINVEDLDW